MECAVRERTRNALKAARQIGWEGDIREGPFIAGFPNDPDATWAAYMIAWKQQNNGMSFICAPFPLPHVGAKAWAAGVWCIDQNGDLAASFLNDDPVGGHH